MIKWNIESYTVLFYNNNNIRTSDIMHCAVQTIQHSLHATAAIIWQHYVSNQYYKWANPNITL